jgi:hypothetical protein
MNILFSVVERAGNYVFPATALRARVVSYALGHIRFYRKFWRRSCKKGSFNWKLRGLVPFLVVKSDQRVNAPPPTPIILPNPSNQIFEIAILFSVPDRSRSHFFEDSQSPKPSGQGL